MACSKSSGGILCALLIAAAIAASAFTPAAFAAEEWSRALNAYVACIDQQAAPRLRDFAKANVPITRGRIEVVVEEADRGCRAEFLDVIYVYNATDALPLGADEANRRLRAIITGSYTLDQSDGNPCWGMNQQFC